MKEEIGLIELHYMPCISMFKTMYSFNTINFQLNRPYGKMSFRNRCLIADSQGLQTLSIPIRGGRGFRGDYGTVLIDDRQPWNVHHWRAVYSAYGRSPWYDHFAPDLEALFLQPVDRLADWNLKCVAYLYKWIGKTFPAIDVSGTERLNIANNQHLKPEDLLSPRSFQSDCYGPFPAYIQVFQEKNGFLPNISMLDFVLCAGPRAVRDWLDRVTLTV